MKQFPYYPIFIDVEQHDIVIIGGGNVCARKAETMMRYGARVTIVSPEITAEIAEWEGERKLAVRRKRYEDADLDGATLVIASTDDTSVNEQVAADCRRRRIPVNVVDVTPLCEFIVPAIIEKDGIQIAVSTGGKSPAIARTLKEDLDRAIGPEYAEVNELLGSLRDSARRTLPTDVDRKQFFDGIIARGVLTMLRDGRPRDAYEAMAAACAEAGVTISAMLRERMAE